MIHRFFATAGNEVLDDEHSDGVHFFRDADWRTFRDVMINPSKWLKEHVPSRADRIQSKLDLMVVPIPHGFTVDYSEDARLVTLGMGPYRHRASTLNRVAEHLYASQRDVDIQGVLHEIRDPELDIVSIHVQLGRWSVWPLIAPVVLQDCNALMQVLVDQAREGRGMSHRIVNPAGHEIEGPQAIPFDLDSAKHVLHSTSTDVLIWRERVGVSSALSRLAS